MMQSSFGMGPESFGQLADLQDVAVALGYARERRRCLLLLC